jgi:hypothetical protein
MSLIRKMLPVGLFAFLLVELVPFAAESQEGVNCGMVETPNGPEFWGACRGTTRQAPPKPDVWGAIAVALNFTLPGFAYNYPTEAGAKQGALENCASKGGKSCKVAVTVADVCVALAMSTPEKIQVVGGPIGAANYASSGAMLKCQRAGGHSCKVTTSFCADGINHTMNASTVYSNGNPIAVAPGQTDAGFGRRR